MSGPSTELTPVIAATTQWLAGAYPSPGSFLATLAELQARQAVTVAAWLRYPTALDAGLLAITGPGGSARLDWLLGAGEPTELDALDGGDPGELAAAYAWRTWVDEVVASWAACLLTDRALAADAVRAVTGTAHSGRLPTAFRRLTAPDARDLRAAPLLRHPDLLAPLAELHRAELLLRLDECRGTLLTQP